MLPSGEVEPQENQEVSFSIRNNQSNYKAVLLLEIKDLCDPKSEFYRNNSITNTINLEVK